MRRVVVTGMGCVTPVGNDVPSFWESLKAGKCGIGPITHFDTADHKAKVAAEVKARFGVQDVVINYVGPVIGAHSGPGTLALFFLGSKR